MFGRRAPRAAAGAGPKPKWRLDLEEGSSEESSAAAASRRKRPARTSSPAKLRGAAAGAARATAASAADGARGAAPAGRASGQAEAARRDEEEAGSDGDGGAAEEPPPAEKRAKKKKKEKAFAWMDSSDDSDGGDAESEGSGAAGAGPAKGAADGARGAAPAGRASGQDGAADARGGSEDIFRDLEDVRTFSHFMRLSPRVLAALHSMSAGHFVTLCRAAARVKYFDGELFGEVFKVLAPKIKAQEFTPTQLADVVGSLQELNACDAAILAATTAFVAPKVAGMDKALRLRWLDLLRDIKSPHCEALSREFAAALRAAPVPEDSLPLPTSKNPLVLTHMQQTCQNQGGFGLLGNLMSTPVRPGVGTAFGQNLRAVHSPPCRHWSMGFCSLGSECSFRHDGPAGLAALSPAALPGAAAASAGPPQRPPPQRPPMARPRGAGPSAPQGPRFPMPARTSAKICIHYSQGNCSWGAKCHFLHVVGPRMPSPG